VFDVGWTDDGIVPWFAMELLEGRDLADEVKAAGGSLPLIRAISIIVQVLDALEVAHGQGIVHRDLKPENAFLVRHGIEDAVEVLDFGISKIIDKRTTVTGMILGTPAYMSPEQARGDREVDRRVDLCAMGAILFEVLAGRPLAEHGGDAGPARRRRRRDRATHRGCARVDPQLADADTGLAGAARGRRRRGRGEHGGDGHRAGGARGHGAADGPRRRLAGGAATAPRRRRSTRALPEAPPAPRWGWVLALVALLVLGAGALALALSIG
jgi:hypothetical protein